MRRGTGHAESLVHERRGLGIVPLSILKRPMSRHPAFWDAGEPGDNIGILLDHAEMILSGTVGVNAAFGPYGRRSCFPTKGRSRSRLRSTKGNSHSRTRWQTSQGAARELGFGLKAHRDGHGKKALRNISSPSLVERFIGFRDRLNPRTSTVTISTRRRSARSRS